MAEDSNIQPDVLSVLVAEIRSLREENARRNAQFEERFITLEHQQVRSSDLLEPTPSVTTGAPTENAPAAATHGLHISKRPKLRDIPRFGGDKTQWRNWRLETEGKLRVDKDALGDAEGHFMYVFMSLEGKAKDNVTTFVEMQIDKRTFDVAELLNRLELLYGERDRKQKATRNLHLIKQGENEPFASFYPRFEREIANANAEYWPDDSKISYLQEALNDKMKGALIGSDPSVISSYAGLATRCDSLSSQMELLGQWKKPRNSVRETNSHNDNSNGNQAAQKQPAPKVADRREDMMEWEPTPQTSSHINAARTRSGRNIHGFQSRRPEDQALLGKRAKWVDKGEMDARYREGRCLRCGRDSCRVDRCPLAAPIRPTNAAGPTQINAVTPSRPVVTKAEIVEDDVVASPLGDEDSE